jgi:hypothetical protein
VVFIRRLTAAAAKIAEERGEKVVSAEHFEEAAPKVLITMRG